MKYTGTLIAVRDMEKAKQFYLDVLGLQIVDDFGANVMLTGGIFFADCGKHRYGRSAIY